MFLNNYSNSKQDEEMLLKEMLFEKIVRIFEWKGLPFPQREIEMRLITTGCFNDLSEN